MLKKMLTALEADKGRRTLYLIIAVGFFFAAVAFVSLKGTYNFVVSDGRGYYVYLPSVVIDQDLDFSNQIRENWDVDFSPALVEDKTPLGYVRNKYPIGFALSLLPSFALAHGTSKILFSITGLAIFRPDGYSAVYQTFTLLTVLCYGLLMMLLLDRLLKEHFKMTGTVIFLAIASFWAATHYAYYYFREPVMVHVVSAFWVTACLYFGRLAAKTDTNKTRNLAAMLLAFTFAVVARPTNMFLGLFVFFAGVSILRSVSMRTILLRYSVIAAIAALPALLQMGVWKAMNGSWISYSYKSEGFIHWKNPFLFSTLFSSKHGLFFWSPVLLLSVLGLLIYLRKPTFKRDLVLYPLLIGGCALWYLNSSWHQWWFGDAFGGRSFLELAPLFVFGLAFFFDAVQRSADNRLRILTATILIGLTLYTYALMGLYMTHKIPRADYLF
ncbi:MAG: hypothetical protein RL189_1172 [Pseudomonadota bacterium]|jgi:hypothetical protein